MMKHLITFCSIFTFTVTLSGQTSLPYYTGFDDASGKMDWQEYRLGDNSLYQWNYTTATVYSPPECLSHNYPVGGTQVTDDWFVSPQFDFSAGGTLDSLRYHFSGFGMPMTGDTVAVYILNGSKDPESASRTMICDFTDSLYQNDDTWRRLENVTIPSVSGASYIAFRYTTTNNWLDVRMDNLHISASNIGLSQLHAVTELKLYPNPAGNSIHLHGIDLSGALHISITDTQGRIIKEVELESRDGSTPDLDVSEVPAGLYFLKLINAQGEIRSGRFLKK